MATGSWEHEAARKQRPSGASAASLSVSRLEEDLPRWIRELLGEAQERYATLTGLCTSGPRPDERWKEGDRIATRAAYTLHVHRARQPKLNYFWRWAKQARLHMPRSSRPTYCAPQRVGDGHFFSAGHSLTVDTELWHRR
jgi:hypothetical protein